MASVTTIGFKEFEKKCENLTAELMEEFDLEVLEAARHWEELSKNDAPNDQGNLINSIKGDTDVTVVSKTDHSAEVVSGASYSAFLEWGTRKKVRIPAGLQSYAAEFRGDGSGKGQAKFMIYEWMKRVGIPKEFQGLVFFLIMVNGINPQPFFFIQEPIVSKEFYKNLQNILDTEH